MLERVFNISIRYSFIFQFGNVPLGVAALNGHISTVKTLLDANANINYQNKVHISSNYVGHINLKLTTKVQTLGAIPTCVLMNLHVDIN